MSGYLMLFFLFYRIFFNYDVDILWAKCCPLIWQNVGSSAYRTELAVNGGQTCGDCVRKTTYPIKVPIKISGIKLCWPKRLVV